MRKKTYICLGRAPLSGCGVTLTTIEVRAHETSCEHCEAAFQQRWRNWCLGDKDIEFEELFGTATKPKALGESVASRDEKLRPQLPSAWGHSMQADGLLPVSAHPGNATTYPVDC